VRLLEFQYANHIRLEQECINDWQIFWLERGPQVQQPTEPPSAKPSLASTTADTVGDVNGQVR
jgi:hypothetical protein